MFFISEYCTYIHIFRIDFYTSFVHFWYISGTLLECRACPGATFMAAGSSAPELFTSVVRHCSAEGPQEKHENTRNRNSQR